MAFALWEHCCNRKRLSFSSAAVQGFALVNDFKILIKGVHLSCRVFFVCFFEIINFHEFFLPLSDTDYIHFRGRILFFLIK